MSEYDKSIGSKREVWNKTAKQTAGGLKRKDLVRVKDAQGNVRIKSKKQHLAGKKMKKGKNKWAKAMKKARKELDIEGFVPVQKAAPKKGKKNSAGDVIPMTKQKQGHKLYKKIIEMVKNI